MSLNKSQWTCVHLQHKLYNTGWLPCVLRMLRSILSSFLLPFWESRNHTNMLFPKRQLFQSPLQPLLIPECISWVLSNWIELLAFGTAEHGAAIRKGDSIMGFETLFSEGSASPSKTPRKCLFCSALSSAKTPTLCTSAMSIHQSYLFPTPGISKWLYVWAFFDIYLSLCTSPTPDRGNGDRFNTTVINVEEIIFTETSNSLQKHFPAIWRNTCFIISVAQFIIAC